VTPRTFDRAEAAREIHAKVVELARARGIRVTGFRDNEVIPETNLLDSAGIMELIVWYETRFDLAIEQADLTIENFGTVNAMVDYLARA